MMEPHDYGLSGLGNAMSDVTLTDVNGGHVETNDVPLRGNPYSSVYNTRHTPTFPNMRPDYLFLKYVLSDSGSHARTQPPVTSLCFDRQEELLWMGNEGGHVTSYYGLDMVKYTSFQVHSENDIRAQLTGDYGLLSLTKNSLRLSLRRGLTAFNHTSDHLNDMYCMSLTENPSIILMAGQQSELLDFDLNLMKPVRITNLENDPSANSLPGCMIIRSHPRFVCCGDATGKITLRDNSSLKVQHTLSCHSGQLSDFDVCGNHLVTCGYSTRNGIYNVDRFLMVYDLRMIKAIAPIGMNYAPFLLRFVPIYSSKFCVVSPSGQFTLMDTSGPSNPPSFVHNIDLPPGSSVSAFDVSNSSQALAFSDSMGYIYLFGASSEVMFNVNSQNTEFADSLEIPPSIPFDDLVTPFTSVPPVVLPDPQTILTEGPLTDAERVNKALEDYLSSLSSSWPLNLCRKVYRRSKPIDPGILSSMKMTGSIGYAPNPSRLRFQDNYLENTDDIVEPTFASTFPRQDVDEEQQGSKDDLRQSQGVNDHHGDQEDSQRLAIDQKEVSVVDASKLLDKESHLDDQTTHGQSGKQSSEGVRSPSDQQTQSK